MRKGIPSFFSNKSLTSVLEMPPPKVTGSCWSFRILLSRKTNSLRCAAAASKIAIAVASCSIAQSSTIGTRDAIADLSCP
jgi:hypothetical protein